MSSSTHIPSSPIRSEALRANPNQRAYVLHREGQDIHVTLAEAREWFQHGYTILDPQTRQSVDIGGVSIPAYADGRGAFTSQEEEVEKGREALEREQSERGEENAAAGSGGRGVNGRGMNGGGGGVNQNGRDQNGAGDGTTSA